MEGAREAAAVRSLFPGPLVAANSGSLDVSFQRLAAYGAGAAVCVVDVEGGQALVQTLDGHPGNVCVCRWGARIMDTNLDFEYKLTLASGDDRGNVMLWSVLEGVAELHLTDSPVGAVLDLAWHPTVPHLLLTLRAGNVVALWDVSKGTCVWRRLFKNMDDMFCVAFNAFPAAPPHRDVFFGTRKGGVYHLQDVLGPEAAVADLVVKYKIAPPEAKSTFNGIAMYEAAPGCVLFVLSRELMVFDMATQHSVGGFSLDRGMAPLMSVSTCAVQPGLMWALHEDGRVSLWRSQPPAYLSFALVSASSPLRFSKTRRQEPQPLVGLQVLAHHSGYQHACLTIDRLGTLGVWTLEGTTIQAAELRQGLLSAVTSFALHPELGARQVACGTAGGTLAIVDLTRRVLLREIVIDAGQPVANVRWFSADSVLVYVVQEVQADAVWVNSVLRVALPTGRVWPLLQAKRAEPTFIRAVKVSPSGRYMLVLRKDRPLELWDVTGEMGAHLGNVKPYIQVNAIAWRDGGDGGVDEFAAATSDNMIRTFRVEGGRLTPVRQQEGLTISPINCVAWRGDTLATGDASGSLTLFDWRRKVCWTINTRGAGIVDMRWNPASSTVLLLFANGSVCIFDMIVKRQLSESTLLSVRSIRGVEIAWAGADSPMVACSDGALRILDAHLSSCNAFVPPLEPGVLMTTPYLLDARVALALKVGLLGGGRVLSSDNGGAGAADAMLAVPPRLLNEALSDNMAQRALAVARFFGDSFEESVWLFVLGLIPKLAVDEEEKRAVLAQLPVIQERPVLEKRQSVHEFLGQETVNLSAANRRNPHKPGTLPSRFGLLRPDADVRDQFVAETKALDNRRGTQDAATFHTTASRFILNGDRHNAIAVLSGTDPAWASFEKDSLMACVVAAASGPEYFERATKMAATGLIARGDVDLGVQLLVLVGKADEACRYLQDAGRWDDAVRLARLQLPPGQRDEVLRKWGEHLSAVQDVRQAVLVFLSLGHVARAVALLHAQDRFQLALGLLGHFGDVDMDEQLVQGMHLDYGFFLHRLGLLSAQDEFALAGPAGLQMREALTSAPFELRGRNRSGSGVIMSSASKRGLLATIKDVKDDLKAEFAELRKK
jgi:WD40 repeat protein